MGFPPFLFQGPLPPFPEAGLTVHWPMSEASGTRAGHVAGFDLTAENNPGSAAGEAYPLAADFDDAASQALVKTYAANIDIPSASEFSFIYRFFVDESTINMTTVCKGNGGATGGTEFMARTRAGPTMRAFFGIGGADFLSDRSFAIGVWRTHLIYRRIDGATTFGGASIDAGTRLEHAGQAGTPTHDTTRGIGIGRTLNSASFYLDGRIGPASLYIGKVLSAAEELAWHQRKGHRPA